MGIFSFFKKTDKVGVDSAVNTKEIGESAEQSTSQELVKTKLSFHPDWNVPQEQQYVFRFLANDLEPLKPNHLSLAAINIEIDEWTGNWNVKAFLRSSLPKEIELEEVELLLIDKNDNVIGSKTFDLKELGTIPPESARPWVFTFEKEYLKTDELPEDGWKIAFNVISLRGHQLDLDEAWEKQLPQDQKELLADIVKKLPKLGNNEVNLTGLQIILNEDQSIHASIFIRNGHFKAINLEQLPLEIIDANGKQVAKGTFKLDPVLTVQPNSTKPWTFIFPKELVDAEGADLSRWTARILQK